jgi:glucose-1-phosphate thymidylyltransferase
MRIPNDIIGLVPAAGKATRISPLPCSKELYPLSVESSTGEAARYPKVACHYLLEKMRLAGCGKAYIVLRDGKWDIPAYLGSGERINLSLAYLVADVTFGVPFTIDYAYPFTKEAVVLFGFPDILFEPKDGFVRLLASLSRSNADVVLGLFPANGLSKEDLIEVGPDGEVKRVVTEPSDGGLRRTWGIAAWRPVFTEYIHEYVLARKDSAASSPELIAGHIMEKAVSDGLHIEAMVISDTPYLDIGTPAGLSEALRRAIQQAL